MSDTLTATITVEDALGGADPSEMEDEFVEGMIELEKDIRRSELLKERAREALDEDSLPEAERLLWIDQAEVYPLCYGCYQHNKDGQWTGSTQHPDYEDLRETMHERLQEGAPCAFCKSDRVEELKDEIAEQIEVEFTVEVDGYE